MTKTRIDMQLENILQRIADWFKKRGKSKMITKLNGDYYLERFYVLFPLSWEKYIPFNVYLHRFYSSDEGDLHDHPWHNASLVLTGAYFEQTPLPPEWEDIIHSSYSMRRAGDVIFRKATDRHKIELINDKPVWTLFFMGRRFREWGFYKDGKWIEWRTYLRKAQKEQI